MKNKNLYVLIAGLALSTSMLYTACNSENSNNKNAEKMNDAKFDNSEMQKDADFAMEAASGGMMEVEAGKLAAEKGMSAKVKEFGQNMVTDHSQANEELKTLAASKNITLPAAPNADMQKKIDELKSKTGSDFDKCYVDMMVKDHKDDIDAFKKEAEKGNDAEVKEWANGKVPVLEHHLHMIEEIQNTMK